MVRPGKARFGGNNVKYSKFSKKIEISKSWTTNSVGTFLGSSEKIRSVGTSRKNNSSETKLEKHIKNKTIETKEITYNVPLRKGWLKVPRYKRSKKAVSVLREFIIRHTKCEEVKISKRVNEFIWKDGIKNPPHHIEIKILKKENIAFINLG